MKYKIVKMAEAGVKGGGTYKYCARLADIQKRDFEHALDSISFGTTLAKADVAGVLRGLMEYMELELTDGNIIDLGDFGRFWVSMRSELKDTPEEVTALAIKEKRIQFTPGKRLKKIINASSVSKQAPGKK